MVGGRRYMEACSPPDLVACRSRAASEDPLTLHLSGVPLSRSVGAAARHCARGVLAHHQARSATLMAARRGHSDALTDIGACQDALLTVPSGRLRASSCRPDFDRDLRSPWHTPRHLPCSWSHTLQSRESDQMTPRFASLPIWGMPALPHRHGVMPPCPRSITSHLTAMCGCS